MTFPKLQYFQPRPLFKVSLIPIPSQQIPLPIMMHKQLFLLLLYLLESLLTLLQGHFQELQQLQEPLQLSLQFKIFMELQLQQPSVLL